MRMLKYTPEHMHCYPTFYGPMSLPGPNTGFCTFNALSEDTLASSSLRWGIFSQACNLRLIKIDK
ncbi:hypothetical protein C8R44DRAFT_626284 [Mycena epipterygia]|nr:hypothetical protein C8R44DRAFT_626284 [Mycena epipterygia]